MKQTSGWWKIQEWFSEDLGKQFEHYSKVLNCFSIKLVPEAVEYVPASHWLQLVELIAPAR